MLLNYSILSLNLLVIGYLLSLPKFLKLILTPGADCLLLYSDTYNKFSTFLISSLENPFFSSSLVLNSYWNHDVEDNAYVLMKNKKNNVNALIHSSATQWNHKFRLEINLETIPISDTFLSLEESLKTSFKGLPNDITEENLQSRIRGTILMAISNKKGKMLITTGNKSEVSVGYSTLYGDMNGGFNPIKDIYKTELYALANWRNINLPNNILLDKKDVIPASIISKEPTAELRDNQKDSDSLPPYDLLDPILLKYIENDKSSDEIKISGLSAAEIKRVVKLVDASEYKRRQGPPGVKITPKAFGKDRRFPITIRRGNN